MASVAGVRVRMGSAVFAVCASLLLAGAARAEVKSVGGAVQLIAPPANAQLNQHQSNTLISVWNEKQNFTTTGVVPYSINGKPGTYGSFADVAGVSGTLPVGSKVDSHMIHFDQIGPTPPGGLVLTGTIDFATPIVAVSVVCADLLAADPMIGPAGTLYPPNCTGSQGLRGVDWTSSPGSDPITIAVSPDRRRITVSLRAGNDLDEIRVLTKDEFQLSGAIAFGILRKNGAEFIINLGDPGAIPAAGFNLNLAALPAAFGGNLLGAQFFVVGSLDPTSAQTNLVFSACDEWTGLSGAQLTTAFQRLVGGGTITDGFLKIWLNNIPDVGAQQGVLSSNPQSFTSLIDEDFLGAWPDVEIDLAVGDDDTLTPVVAATSQPLEFEMRFPLYLGLDGLLRPLKDEDVKSETWVVFSKNDTELVVNIGSHDDLPANPFDITAFIPPQFGPDKLVGAKFVLVGFFLESHHQSNLMFSAVAPPPSLTDATIFQAFNNLSGSQEPAVLGFLDLHATLAPRQTLVIPNAGSDPLSFHNQFDCDGRGAFAFTICGTVGASPLTLPILGAAAGPVEASEYAEVGTVSIDPTSEVISGTDVLP